MASSFRTYRHRGTGLIGHYDPRLASAFPELVEVNDDAKPLAYTPIPSEAVEAVLEQRSTEPDGDTESDPAPDSVSVDPSTPSRPRKERRTHAL